MNSLESYTFRAVSFPWRLHVGIGALDHLADEVRRTKAQRAFVVCGQTVAYKTNLLQRVKDQLGSLYAGVFDAMDKDSSWPAVEHGVKAARAVGADLLMAIGGGSVIVGTRAVAILLAEQGDPLTLMTQYPPGQPAVSPRLLAPKPPIINIVTTPTTAMNRAGTGLKNDQLDHRMEFYDPKTRPTAIFWDAEALLTAPPALVRSTATSTFSSALRNLASPTMNPLSGDRSSRYCCRRNGDGISLAAAPVDGTVRRRQEDARWSSAAASGRRSRHRRRGWPVHRSTCRSGCGWKGPGTSFGASSVRKLVSVCGARPNSSSIGPSWCG